MKKSFAAALLVLSLALGAAAPAAVRAEEIGPGIGLEEKIAAQQAAAQAGVTAAAEETTAAQSAETAGAAANTAAANTAAQNCGCNIGKRITHNKDGRQKAKPPALPRKKRQ